MDFWRERKASSQVFTCASLRLVFTPKTVTEPLRQTRLLATLWLSSGFSANVAGASRPGLGPSFTETPPPPDESEHVLFIQTSLRAIYEPLSGCLTSSPAMLWERWREADRSTPCSPGLRRLYRAPSPLPAPTGTADQPVPLLGKLNLPVGDPRPPCVERRGLKKNIFGASRHSRIRKCGDIQLSFPCPLLDGLMPLTVSRL